MNSSDKNFTSFSLKVARMSSEQPLQLVHGFTGFHPFAIGFSDG